MSDKTEHKHSRRCPIIQKDLQGNIIAYFDSVEQAKKITGFTSIHAVLHGHAKTCRGFVFEYVNPDKKYIYSKSTLCLDCNTPSPTCSWKYKLKPVEGWEATSKPIRLAKGKVATTYVVKNCPLFEKNDLERHK